MGIVLDFSAFQCKYAYPSPCQMNYDRIAELYHSGEIDGVIFRYARGKYPDVRLPEFYPALKARGVATAGYGVFNPFEAIAPQVSAFKAMALQFPIIGAGVMGVRVAGDVEIPLPGMSQLVYASLLFQYVTGIQADTLYSNENSWETLVGHQADGWHKALQKWVANYENPLGPRLPDGWETYLLWQYSETGSGAYYGCGSIHVDLNRWNPIITDPPPVEPPPEPGDCDPLPVLTVQSETLNIRVGPGTSYAIVGELDQGDQVTVYDVVPVTAASVWAKIEPETEGYCAIVHGGVKYLA